LCSISERESGDELAAALATALAYGVRACIGTGVSQVAEGSKTADVAAVRRDL
jgi:hypothetical protein